ncbi:NADPH-dependent FMN reductase [Nostocales cyanobacterium HT-58-2]|nr:NADPH-dependent FMN reductase [Nostocales cyanobacterium HT-58-2]
MTNTPLFIPVILGTPRQGRQSEYVAKFLVEQIATRDDVTTELIDIRKVPMTTNDAGESIKDPQFSGTVERADGLIIVAPEYNHGYPGLLKHLLDTCLKEYIHKAVGLCGVSAGPFGGTRVIQNLLPVMRELGLITIFYDLNFSNVQDLFDESGNLIDKPTYIRRLEKFMNELVWMSSVLRYGRQEVNVPASQPSPEVATSMDADAKAVGATSP